MKLRQSRLAAAVVTTVVVVLITGAGVLFGATAAGANPGISVSPSTGLHNGQVVTVTGSGFARNGTVYIVECKAGATAEGQCSFTFSDLSTVVVAKADASGNLHSSSPTLKTSFKTTDCTKVACEIAAHQTLSTQLSATNTAVHTISFGAVAHPSTNHSTPRSSAAHSSGASTTGAITTGTTSTGASQTTSTGSSTAGTAASSSSKAAARATSGGSATGSAPVSSNAPPEQDSTTAAAHTVKLKAKNGGRYLLVAIVGVLAVLYIASMAISGRRAARR